MKDKRNVVIYVDTCESTYMTVVMFFTPSSVNILLSSATITKNIVWSSDTRSLFLLSINQHEFSPAMWDKHIVAESHKGCSRMFRWEAEGHYHHRRTAIAPFWFSTGHLWTSLNALLALNWWYTYMYTNIEEHQNISTFLFHKEEYVGWEPEGRYCSSKMFRWEPEGRYRCTKSMAIVPFWFSMEHRWSAVMPLLALNWRISLPERQQTLFHCMN